MELDPPVPPYKTSDPTSFASVSALERWPVILTSAIDDVHRSIFDVHEADAIQEGKRIVEDLAKLKYELQHNRPLTPLDDDGLGDIADYNAELKARGNPTWLDVSWLYSECYLYRRIHTLFRRSKHWTRYDVFHRQKMSTFRSSRAAVLELAARFRELQSDFSRQDSPAESEARSNAEKLLFSEMCEICLWGNATDLSLLTSLTYEDIQKLQGSEARKSSEHNILVNDLPTTYAMLKEQQQQHPQRPRRIDVVLDNAGFELFVDLLLVSYLLGAGLATEIVLHPKSMPWFVSDVIPADVTALMQALASPQSFYSTETDDDRQSGRNPQPLSEQETSNLQYLHEQWSKLFDSGKIRLENNTFWTHAGSYWRLPKVAPELASMFQASDLVIWKGDLNYRKLTGDAQWDTTTSFTEAIGPLGQGSNIRILTLRTCKADTVVGLPAGEDERLKATANGGGDSGARKWAWSGKWAVVQYSDGKQ